MYVKKLKEQEKAYERQNKQLKLLKQSGKSGKTAEKSVLATQKKKQEKAGGKPPKTPTENSAGVQESHVMHTTNHIINYSTFGGLDGWQTERIHRQFQDTMPTYVESSFARC